jgi:thiamine biosynthesis lipoprotein
MPLQEALPVGRGIRQWPVWSTTARVITADPERVEEAQRLVAGVVAEVDRAASRFRADSEVMQVAAADGRPVRVTPMLATLLDVALEAARSTNGAVDPTLGGPLTAIGYDRSFEVVAARDAKLAPLSGPTARIGRSVIRAVSTPSWRDVEWDGTSLRTPPGVVLDLGATAKAWAADHAAHLVAAHLESGVLVALGGDIATAGAEGGPAWTILVQDGADQPPSLVTLTAGAGLATSSTLGRTWRSRGQWMHHIVDPLTGLPASTYWRTVSIATESCLAANVLSTAAVVAGPAAMSLLRDDGDAAARLVRHDGTIVTINGWPDD